MDSGLVRQLPAVLLGAAVVTSFWTRGTTSQTVAQPAANTAAAAEKELEGAAAKVREGKIDEAMNLIKERAGRHPEWPPPRLILGRLLFGTNQAPAGRQALELAAIETPDDPEVYLTLGGLSLGDGRASDAQLNFDRVLALLNTGRSNAEKTKLLRREAVAGLASVAEARADWKTAQQQLNAWLELDPKNGRVRQRLARALFQLGKSEDAFNTLTQAVKDEPALEPPGVTMAGLESQKGDIKKAEEWFDYARRLEPKNARVRLAHGGWLVDQGRAADARGEVDEALKLDPSLQEAKRVQSLVAWHLRDLAGAEKILEPLHRDSPADSLVANLLALTLIEQDDAAKQSRGMQLAEVNALQFPRSTDVIATLGWALYRAGKLDQAEQKLHAAVTSGRTTADIAYFLARIMADKGQTDTARKVLQDATSAKVPFAHRDDANALLKKLTK
jgi:tetratricopeptide (TPR) repeat protein